MSHFTVLVIGPDPETQLEPYDENGEGPREKSKWDWYELGGRWTGFFALKLGMTGEVGEPGFMTEPCIDPGRADQARKADIDWDAMNGESGEKARAHFETVAASPGGVEAMFSDVGDMSLDEFVQVKSIATTFAVVKDGKWFERGEMGWWGLISEEKPPDEWANQWMMIVDTASDDALFSLYDCHV